MANRQNTEPKITPGRPYPLGATVEDGGVNFSLFSANATGVELLLFDRYDQPEPTQIIPLDPRRNKTFHYWHVFVRGIGDGQVYGYRVRGPYEPEQGFRFNGKKVLLDPYAAVVAYGKNWSRAQACGFMENTQSALKGTVVDLSQYDWEGDQPLGRPMEETIIYEMHVRGFTADPSANVAQPGTYAGVVEKIPYLQSLGVTAVELLPVQQFDEQEVSRLNPLTGEPLRNYWGYAPVAWFAPHLGYASNNDPRRVVDEFRDMVKALHRAGIEVILDVVFNHTAENDHTGPTISFRGLENPAYYMLKSDRRFYRNYSGTGNTVNCNQSVVRHMIRRCLRHWVTDFHIDGFRFDLASVLSRDMDGNPIKDSPILWELETDPVLAGTKLIAEAWDAAGLYQVGSFTGNRWAEWNGRFRDDLRRFVRGGIHTVRDFAWRVTGSFDIFYNKPMFASYRSINYVTCHDGFTLADLVAYNTKHNWANGEYNRDGASENFSWNHGVEGPTDDPRILRLRHRQMKNYMALLLVSRGTPMLLGGDEMGRTQFGNNNAYCQDNEVSWFDWHDLSRNRDLVRFVQGMIAFRKRHPTLTYEHELDSHDPEEALRDMVTFHGVRLGRPDWSAHSHSLAIHLHPAEGDTSIYIIANSYLKTLEFELPNRRWKRVVDTFLDAPDDLVDEEHAPLWEQPVYQAGPRSVVVLVEARE
ncbi:MAG: glycogen debranching protein GlgX [Chloroflexi bacterium]|nr:glycogen debranching protein GlgX [Chloroflexota bacterium]